jgi:4-diphosphocytidyl-2-C-methyl-D-erythritol kinase
MQGVGEVITDMKHLPAPAIVLINPLEACGTADVFRQIGLKAGDLFGAPLDAEDAGAWRNDMTAAAIAVLPVIADVLQALHDVAPRATVRMSGSGATCFALLDSLQGAETVGRTLSELHPKWWIASALIT